MVVHTPLQHLIAHHMIKSMSEFDDPDNFLVLDMVKQDLSQDKHLWKEIFYLDPPVGGSILGGAKRCRKALKTISDLIDQYEFIQVFVSDINWPLNNALYGLLFEKRNENIRLCNFPDGTGNLLIVYPNKFQQFRKIVKSILGRLGGFPYYYFGGDTMGLEMSDKIYSLLPSAINSEINAEVVAIPMIEPAVINENPEACIFLGENINSYVPQSAFREICTRAAEYTRNLGYEDLFYKPHHFANSSIEKDTFMQFGFQLINSSLSIEEMFLVKQVPCIVSYNSSALLHLKLMFGDKVRCISYCCEEVLSYSKVDANVLKRLIKLYELCGVEYYNQ